MKKKLLLLSLTSILPLGAFAAISCSTANSVSEEKPGADNEQQNNEQQDNQSQSNGVQNQEKETKFNALKETLENAKNKLNNSQISEESKSNLTSLIAQGEKLSVDSEISDLLNINSQILKAISEIKNIDSKPPVNSETEASSQQKQEQGSGQQEENDKEKTSPNVDSDQSDDSKQDLNTSKDGVAENTENKDNSQDDPKKNNNPKQQGDIKNQPPHQVPGFFDFNNFQQNPADRDAVFEVSRLLNAKREALAVVNKEKTSEEVNYSNLEELFKDLGISNETKGVSLQILNQINGDNQKTLKIRLYKTSGPTQGFNPFAPSDTIENFIIKGFKKLDNVNHEEYPTVSEETKNNKTAISNIKYDDSNVSSTFNFYKNAVLYSKNKKNKLNKQDLFNQNYARSFAVSFHATDTEPEAGKQVDPNNAVINLEPGTAWLLDYATPKNNKDELTLFLGTNLHVASSMFNALDDQFKNDNQLRDIFAKDDKWKLLGISLGAANESRVNKSAVEDKSRLELTNKAQFITNYQKASTEDNYDKKTSFVEGAISNVKTIFVGANFFDEQTNKEITDLANKNIEEDKKTSGFAKDFAVFAVTVNLKKLKESSESNATNLASHIEKAKEQLDKDIDRSRKNNLPNQFDNSVPFVDIDYLSLQALNKDNKLFTQRYGNELKQKSFTSTREIYIGGYPSDGSFNPRYVHNYANSYIIPEPVLDPYSYRNTIDVSAFGRKYSGLPLGDVTVPNSALYYGASGSMVTNEFGLVVGIYSGVQPKTNNANSIWGTGSFTTLAQSSDFYYEGSKTVIPAHNLIDGSNKRLYPKQEKSYRQNLKKINDVLKLYDKTALFETI